MFKVFMTDNAKGRILEILQNSDEDDASVRIREYSTGTPCCRKTVLGLTVDAQV